MGKVKVKATSKPSKGKVVRVKAKLHAHPKVNKDGKPRR